MTYSRSRLIAIRNRLKHEINLAKSRSRQREREIKRINRSLKNR